LDVTQTVIIRLILVLALLVPLCVPAAAAGGARTHHSPTLALHEKAEDLYRTGHHERAYFIYVNELAAIGDKYAQYMAGYMWLNGQGVPQDRVRASAWYRLAAERDSPEFVAVRDQLLESMDEAEREESDAVYLRLRQEYSDLVIAMAQLRLEREQLNDRPTGSHLNSQSSSYTIIDPRSGVTMTRREYVERLESSMQIRLDFITARLGIDRVEADMNDREFADLAATVDEHLQVINDR
jgi:hypothetical protein